MTLINNTHVSGVHCSSTAIADLVRFHHFDWSEAFCFGIGGGLGVTYLQTPDSSPTRLLHTRSLGYEKRFFNAIGVDDFSWLSASTEEESEQQLLCALNEGGQHFCLPIFFIYITLIHQVTFLAMGLWFGVMIKAKALFM